MTNVHNPCFLRGNRYNLLVNVVYPDDLSTMERETNRLVDVRLELYEYLVWYIHTSGQRSICRDTLPGVTESYFV